MSVSTVIGLIGVFVILIWYLFLQIGKVKAEDLSFSVANAFGSVCILYSLLYDWNLPTVVIEISWLLISLFGVYKWFRMGKIS